MPWSDRQKIHFLLQLPWSIVPSREDDEIVVRVREVPSVVVSGTDPDSLEREFWECLAESLATYLHFGDALPRPERYRGVFPWEEGWREPIAARRLRLFVNTGEQPRIEEERGEIATAGTSLQPA